MIHIKLSIISILVITLWNINPIYSQLVNKWEIVDSSSISYFSNNTNIAYVNENDIVLFGNVSGNTSSSMIYNHYAIFKLTDKARVKNTIYYDTINVTDVYNTKIVHPSEDVIAVAGYNASLLGDFNGKEYLYSSLLLLSTDSGLTWDRQIIDSNEIFLDISMCDGKNGIIARTNKSNYLNSNNFVIEYNLLSTNDSWKTHKIVEIPNNKNIIRNIYCISENHWIIIAHDSLFFLLITKNAGKTWEQSNYFDYRVRINDIQLLAENYVLAVGARSLTRLNPGLPVIFHSTDGGISWNEDKIFFKENSKNFNDLKNVDFYDRLNGVASAYNQIYRTTDGGNTWKIEDVVPDKDFKNSIYWLRNVIYPAKDFSITCMAKDYIMICENEKILKKPKFYDLYFRYYQPINNLKIRWSPIDGAISYRFKADGCPKDSSDISKRYNFENPKIDTLLYENSLILNNLDSNFRYMMWVKAIGDSVDSEWSIPSKFGTKKFEGQLYPPDLINPEFNEIISPGDVTLVWTNVQEANSYFLVIYDDVEHQLFYKQDYITDTTISIKSFLPSKSYQVLLKSYIDDYTPCSLSQSFFFTWKEPLGIEDNQNHNKTLPLFVYPNPVNNEFYVKIYSYIPQTAIINVHNILGNKVTEKHLILSPGENIIDFDAEFIATGLHCIQLISGTKIHRGLFIKQ